MGSSDQQQQQQQQQQGGGFLGALIKPGWDAAETVLPVLHKCLFALLAVLLYTAQHNPGPLRTHLLCMAALTVGLWASVSWYVRLAFVGGRRLCVGYRGCLASRQYHGHRRSTDPTESIHRIIQVRRGVPPRAGTGQGGGGGGRAVGS